tara:strand:+ start:75 stop:377 length:303 start_codon:yes stop_codon:yes gene_type:complete
MNKIQEAIYVGSREESGIWEVINDIANSLEISRGEAFCLIQKEVNFLRERNDIFLIKSDRLYDSDGCTVLDPRNLRSVTLGDVEFAEKGPFYYFSNLPTI